MKLRVRELREERGWNQTVLGYHSGLSTSQISLIETGKRNPSAETLQGIATALGVEVGDLFPKVLSPQPEREAAAGEPVDYRQLYFDLGRRELEIAEDALQNSSEALGTEDYDEFIKLPVDEQHQRIEWAERWRKMAERILASIKDKQAELGIGQLDELAQRREALASTIETFRKTA